ncbi:WavQ [Vibrio breoganii]|uniref:WavQ n=1 Tax=Vibrio breoganii TaxID=553239 RepID=A0AAP8SV10_9VIBR|nr:WavQ [Vibrio breoganii]NMO74125.1 WavQ [Vibrio breoganii]NMR70870.1 WavQ [Vibrio breoganii]PMG02922.1 WavQ [Vibrio breoganii]PML88186.1 WavQ [Vibrio breoganii]PMP05669.1 WavQ [Vibrio breoganii]
MKFYIYAPSYNENSGGCVVLHKLVHIINEETEHTADLVPHILEQFRLGGLRTLASNAYAYLALRKNKFFFNRNSSFNTPVKTNVTEDELKDSIVVYPEITFGNPLGAKNVVRWFLHQPGHFTGEVCYGTGELYFKFNSMIRSFDLYKSKLSKSELKVIHYPTEIYNTDSVIKERKGDCYMIRKGGHKAKVHDDTAICLDGLSHTEISEIFKKSKRFISYDDYTAYSIFAILSGCESVVVPDVNISKQQWYPLESDRYGIAYGFSEDEKVWANSTKNKVLEHVESEHQRSVSNVKKFVEESIEYFNE